LRFSWWANLNPALRHCLAKLRVKRLYVNVYLGNASVTRLVRPMAGDCEPYRGVNDHMSLSENIAHMVSIVMVTTPDMIATHNQKICARS
jgi:hypothetical protein